jgi:hypothetical protein
LRNLGQDLMPQRDRDAGVAKNDQEGADSAKGDGVF